jgi:O-antigen/teichoic acid export membrane protein
MFWRGVLGYLPVNIVQGLVGLLTLVVFTRLLSPQDFGVYALAFSVTSLVHTSLFTWIEAAVARFSAPEAMEGREAPHAATVFGLWALVAIGLPVIGAGLLLLWPMDPALKIAIAAGLAGSLPRSLAKLVQERRRAAGEVGAAARLDMIQTAGGFAMGAAFAALGAGGAGALAGMGLVSALCLIGLLPQELARMKGGHLEALRARRYMAYGLPVSLSLILSLALSTTDRFLLAAFMDPATVGVYHAGYSLSNRTLDVIFIWLGMAGGPAAIAALESGGLEALRKTAREQASLMILIALPAAVGLALVAKPLAQVMIGEALQSGAAEVVPWIAASGFFAGMTTYYFHTAFTLGHRTQMLLAAMAIPAAANIALNLVLIPRFGLPGALWATTASYGLGAAASYGLGRRIIALPIPWQTLIKASVASLAMAAAVLALPALGGWTELLAKAALGGAVYVALALGMDAGGVRSLLGPLLAKTVSRLRRTRQAI